jgi:hypothetical protein
MHGSRRHKLEALIVALDDHVALARSHGLVHSALFLAAAKLDLQMHVHGISDDELQALCGALDRRTDTARSPRDPARQGGASREHDNIISISDERRQRKTAGQPLCALARGPIRTA